MPIHLPLLEMSSASKGSSYKLADFIDSFYKSRAVATVYVAFVMAILNIQSSKDFRNRLHEESKMTAIYKFQ